MPVDAEGFPTPLAAKLTSLSIGRLEDWYRRGVLKPSIANAKGHGISRVWSFADLVAMRMLEAVRHAGGLSRKRLACAVRYIRKRPVLVEMRPTAYLVIRGEDVFELDLVDDGYLPLADIPGDPTAVLTVVNAGRIVQDLLKAKRALRAA